MSDKEMVIVHEETDEASAQIVVGFLRSWGVEALISEDDAGDQIPSLEATQGVRVFVPVDQAERAKRLLEERRGENSEDSKD